MDGIFENLPQTEDDVLQDLTPWWKEIVLPPPPAAVPYVDRLPLHLAHAVAFFRISNTPTADTIAAVKAWRPDASALMDEWSRVWHRHFRVMKGSNGRNETDHDQEAKLAEREARSLSDPPDASVASIRRVERMLLAETRETGMREWQNHVVDDAELFLSLRHAVPGDTYVEVQNSFFVLEHYEDGEPRLVETPSRRIDDVTDAVLSMQSATEDISYWLSPAFLRRAGRRFVHCREYPQALLVLMAMAREGHRKAFLKSARGKSGTWSVDLVDLQGLRDIAGRLGAVMVSKEFPREGLIVQEHMSFTHEQRFFVVGGRIAGSTCSARQICALDGRDDRILDSRIARIVVPSGEPGPYDRGRTEVVEDRVMSAAFARTARQVVRELADEGLVDYVVDIGLSDGRIVPIELNTLMYSGPYAFRRRRQHEARRRFVRRTLEAVEARRDFLAEAGIDLPRTITAARSLLNIDRESAYGEARRLVQPHRFGSFVFGNRRRGYSEKAPLEHRAKVDRLESYGLDGSPENALCMSIMPSCTPIFSLPVNWRIERKCWTGRLVGAFAPGEDGSIIMAYAIRDGSNWKVSPYPLAEEGSDIHQFTYVLRENDFPERGFKDRAGKPMLLAGSIDEAVPVAVVERHAGGADLVVGMEIVRGPGIFCIQRIPIGDRAPVLSHWTLLPGDAAPIVQGVLFRLPVVEDVGAPKRHIEIRETDRSGAEEAHYGSVQLDWLVGPGRIVMADPRENGGR